MAGGKSVYLSDAPVPPTDTDKNKHNAVLQAWVSRDPLPSWFPGNVNVAAEA